MRKSVEDRQMEWGAVAKTELISLLDDKSEKKARNQGYQGWGPYL